MLSFIAAILLGSFLLWLPVSSATEGSIPYIDALFASATATCVTGLSTLPLATWSTFGQAVILVLIQVGGLGVITVMAAFMIMLQRKMDIGDRLLLQDAFNLNSIAGIIRFLKRVVIGTFTIEAVGALIYMTVFVPRFGAAGVWYSVFTSVSAFCNAGIDILPGGISQFATTPALNFLTCTLVLMGSIGYIVWWDVLNVLRYFKRRGFRCFSSLTLHSKIAITTTAVFLLVSSALFLIFEWNNDATIGTMSVFDRVQCAVFQSVSTMTVGFVSMPTEALTASSTLLALPLMFIGGSPVGCAGGIKTVTFAVLLAAAVSGVLGRNDITLFGRRVPERTVVKAITVSCISLCITVLSMIVLSVTVDTSAVGASATDIIFEAVSATATVGLSRGLTGALFPVGKLIVAISMFFGRIGPISIALAINRSRDNHNIITSPTEDVCIG